MRNFLRWMLPLVVLSSLTLSSCVTAYRPGPPPPAHRYYRHGYGRPLPPPPRGPYRYYR